MCYFLDTEQEINFRSQVIISGYLNVHTEHAQIFLACSIICIYIYIYIYIYIWGTNRKQEGAGLLLHPPPEETDQKENTSF